MSRGPSLLLLLMPVLALAIEPGGQGTGAEADGGVITPDGAVHALQIEAFASPSSATSDGGVLVIEEFAAARSAADAGIVAEARPAADPPASVRVEGELTTAFARDLWFEPPPLDAPPEAVLAGRAFASVALEAELNPSWRIRVEGRARWRASARRGWTHARAQFDPELGEAFVDFYSRWVDLRAGNQLLTSGANPAFAPADVLAPSDLRDLSLLADPSAARLPVPAIRAQGELRWLSWRAVYVPFFVPHRYDVTGDDWALLQPGWGLGFPAAFELDPSIEGRVQPRLLETRRPPDSGLHGDVVLEAGARLPWVDVGLSWIWMNEKLPQVRVDPELAALLDAQQDGTAPEPALLLSLQNRIAAGETLLSGTYRRQHLFSAEVSRLLGPAQLDLDVSFSPGQTFFDERLRPLVKPTLAWKLGATQAESSDWVWSIGWRALAVLGVQADEVLALVEPGTGRGADRTAFLHLVFGGASYRSPRWPLTVQLRAVFEPVQRSYALAPQVRWTVRDRYTLWIGGELWGGPRHSPLGYFDRNDQLLAGVDVRLF